MMAWLFESTVLNVILIISVAIAVIAFITGLIDGDVGSAFGGLIAIPFMTLFIGSVIRLLWGFIVLIPIIIRGVGIFIVICFAISLFNKVKLPSGGDYKR